jgi:TatD DNase family protein
MSIFLVDSHCHFNLLDMEASKSNVDVIVQRAQETGVQYFLNVCVSINDFPALLKTAEYYPFVSASVGLHPNYDDEEVTLEELISLASNDKVVAIGETGLDYYRSSGDLDWQRERFYTHIKAAQVTQKPIIVHSRLAKDDTISIMRNADAEKVGGVMHCFTEDWEMAKKALDLGFYISFSGIVTFKNAESIQEVARKVPLDRILIETDCPYLAPIPYRGKPNEPAYLRHTAEFIAALRGISVDDFAAASTHNFFNLFKGAVKPNV